MVMVDRWLGPGPEIQASDSFLYLFTSLFGLAKNLQQIFLEGESATPTLMISCISEAQDLGSGKVGPAHFFSLDRHQQSFVECYLRSQGRKGQGEQWNPGRCSYSLYSFGTLTW